MSETTTTPATANDLLAVWAERDHRYGLYPRYLSDAAVDAVRANRRAEVRMLGGDDVLDYHAAAWIQPTPLRQLR